MKQRYKVKNVSNIPCALKIGDKLIPFEPGHVEVLELDQQTLNAIENSLKYYPHLKFEFVPDAEDRRTEQREPEQPVARRKSSGTQQQSDNSQQSQSGSQSNTRRRRQNNKQNDKQNNKSDNTSSASQANNESGSNVASDTNDIGSNTVDML